MTVYCERTFGDASVGVSRQTKSLRFSFTQPYKSLIRGTQEAPDVIMKNCLLFLKLLVLVTCLSCALSTAAHDFSAVYNGKTIYYNITGSNTVEVTYRTNYQGNTYSGAISIPSSVPYNSVTYNVTAIGNYAFYCSSTTRISSLSLPSSVETLGYSCLSGQTNLTSLTLPSNLKTIEGSAFVNTGLTSLTIPNSVTSIGEYAFDNNRYLKSVTMGSGITELPACMLSSCGNLQNVTIGSNVMSIGQSAFANDSSLTKIVIPDNVTTIGFYAFQNCYKLGDITLGSAVTQIRMYAFNRIAYFYDDYDNTHFYGMFIIRCKSATPPTLTSSSFDSEHYSKGMIWVATPSVQAAYQAAPYWSNFSSFRTEQAYDFLVHDIYYLKTGSNTASVTYRDIESITYSGDVFVPKTVAFNNVTYNVTGISYGAFGDIRPDNKLISNGAPNLTANTGLYSVVIGNNVTTLGESVFYQNTAMHTVDLGPAVTSIGANSFKDCTALKSVVSRSTTPPTFQSGATSFDLRGFANYTGTLYVPSSAVNTYKSATYWKNFATIRALPTLDEALNVSDGSLTFTSTGAYPWKSMVYNGTFYAMSGNDGVNSSSSTLTATVTVPAGGAPVSFDFKAWGEGSSYDKCIFSVDGTQQFSYGARQNDWESYTVDLSAGTHTLTWTYSKDSSVNPRGDYFAVRNVRLCIEPYVVYTPSNTTLTFYYDSQIQFHQGTLYLLNNANNAPEWRSDGTYANVTKVVIDPSFAAARPTSTRQWFSSMKNLTSITGLSYLNTEKVTSMQSMFWECSKLTSIDVSSFNTAKVTNMYGMFSGCSNLRTIYAGSGWTTNAVTSSGSMFTNCTKLVGGQGTTYSGSHVDKAYAHIDGGTSNPGYFTEWKESYACYTPSNTTLTFYYDNQRSSRTGTTYDLNDANSSPGWFTDGTCASVTKVVIASSFVTAWPTSTADWFDNMTNLTSITGLSFLNTDDVTNMGYMFYNCKKLSNIDVSHFNTANVESMSSMFKHCGNLTSLNLSSFNTAKVTNMYNMFFNCASLTTIYVGSGWSTNAVTSSEVMFYYCDNLVGGQGTTYNSYHTDKAYAHIDGGPSNPGYLTEWKEAYACYTPSNTTLTFYYDGQRSTRPGTTYDLNNDVVPWYSDGTYSSVTHVVFDPSFADVCLEEVKKWFYRMENLQSITGMEYFDTRYVSSLFQLFYGCSSLKSVDVRNFRTLNVTDMRQMFYGCSSLMFLDLTSWNTSVLRRTNDMFCGCTNLTSIYVGDGWNTEGVTAANSAYMFYGCTSLVGGQGTTYDANHVDQAYAHIDGGPSNPGYFTDGESFMFIRGDVDGDGEVKIIDVSALINKLLIDSKTSADRADVNLDGKVTIADVTALISYLLSGTW